MGETLQQDLSGVSIPEDEHDSQGLDQCLEVGTVVFIELNPKSGCAMRYKTAIRGWERDSFLLVDKPGINVRRSQACAVRFMQDGVVWGFYTLISDPSPDREDRMIRLAWPKEVQHVHLRRHERIKVTIPCVIKMVDGSVSEGMIQDMSYGGGCIVSEVRAWEGMKIWLSFTLPDGVQVEALPMQVKNRRPGNGAESFLGCAFVDEKEAERSGIGMFVNRMITMERGQAAAHAHVLLLSGVEEELGILQESVGNPAMVVRSVNGVVDLFHQIRVHIPQAVFINAVQRDMSAFDICRILRGTAGLEGIQIAVYGGELGQVQEKAVAAGASLYLGELTDSLAIQAIFSGK
ncbi:MAG TPA: PilZ domain-containing protein [Candidatus Hydrogenedentes bacterium]|nr:PilZ domain-containing protein [Candidatus Hydrogenedentota bacterium]